MIKLSKINGWAKWSVWIIFTITLIYNTVTTQAVVKNELVHIKVNAARIEKKSDDSVNRIETKLDKLIDFLMRKDKQ